MDVSERARLYVSRIHSISEAGGDAALLKAARAVVCGLDIPAEEALRILTDWNATNASPPWPEAAIRQKIASAQRWGSHRGYLLEGERSGVSTYSPPLPTAPAPVQRPSRPIPAMRIPTNEEMVVIAKIRGISPAAVCLAALHGVLAVGVNRGLPAYFLRGRGITQARRMDGEKWEISGKQVKADTIGAVCGFGISIGLNPNTRRVLMVEGLAGALEAAEAVQRADDAAGECREGVGVLAAYNASSRLSDEQAEYLATRSILILGDAGEPGLEAAKKWRRRIRNAGGADVTASQFSSGDLGTALSASPDCPPEIIQFLNQPQPISTP
jgi:hypothetical protein